MKLSERMHDDRWADADVFVGDVVLLEAELDAERARAQDLASRLDRARTELRAAEAARDANACTCNSTIRRLNRRAQAAESRAIKAERQADKARNQCCGKCDYARGLERAEKVESDYLAVAQALGVVHAEEGCLPVPGPVDACVNAIEELRRAASVDTRTGEVTRSAERFTRCVEHGPLNVDCSSACEHRVPQDAPAPEATREWAVGDACEVFNPYCDHECWTAAVTGLGAPGRVRVVGADGIQITVHESRLRRPIPPTAMEPTIEGGRGLDEADGWRRVSDDTAFAPPFSTVRACRHCGVLVSGGPTACVACVRHEEASVDAITDEDHDLEDLARRRVTERAEGDALDIEALYRACCKDRDREALQAQTFGDIVNSVRRALACEVGQEVACITDRDTRIADLEQRLREAESTTKEWREAAVAFRETLDEERTRRERAEEKLRRVRECALSSNGFVWKADLLRVVDEESGR